MVFDSEVNYLKKLSFFLKSDSIVVLSVMLSSDSACSMEMSPIFVLVSRYSVATVLPWFAMSFARARIYVPLETVAVKVTKGQQISLTLKSEIVHSLPLPSAISVNFSTESFFFLASLRSGWPSILIFENKGGVW